MARMLLIQNPAAARTEPGVVRTVCKVLEREGWLVDVAGTTRPNEAGTLAARGVADGVDVIGVYGGDGTTTQAVSGMIGSGVPLALIPGGTGNLLAGNLGVPGNPAKAALIATRGVRRKIDLGRVERPEGPRYFAVACGAGADGEIMRGAPTATKKRWGSFAYVTSTIKTLYGLAAPVHRITIDDKVLEMDAAVVEIANCGRVTSLRFDLGPNIRLDDGFLDLVVIRAVGAAAGLMAVWELYSGRSNGRITRFRGRRIKIESDVVRPAQADGDVIGETPLTVEVVPGALEVMVGR